MNALKIYVFVMLGFNVIGTVGYMSNLIGEHPRRREPRSVGDDALAVILSMAFLLWQVWLLWGQTGAR